MKKNTKPSPDEEEVITGEPEEYTCRTTGRVITLLPVAYYKLPKIVQKIRADYLARGEPVDVPTYEVAVGPDKSEFQTHEHVHELNEDGSIKESTLETDEDRQAWEDYEDATRRMNGEANVATLRFVLRHGVEADMAEDAGWEEEQEFDGIEVPEDPREKKIHFILTELLPNPAEQRWVSSRIMMKSVAGIDRELESAAKALFRHSLEQPEPEEDKDTPGGSESQPG
jgi:hypothetical protein